jgi:riboflavin transporter FmnP
VTRRVKRSRSSRSEQIGRAAFGFGAGLIVLLSAALWYLLAGHKTLGVDVLSIVGIVLFLVSSVRIYWVLQSANNLYLRFERRRVKRINHE